MQTRSLFNKLAITIGFFWIITTILLLLFYGYIALGNLSNWNFNGFFEASNIALVVNQTTLFFTENISVVVYCAVVAIFTGFFSILLALPAGFTLSRARIKSIRLVITAVILTTLLPQTTLSTGFSPFFYNYGKLNASLLLVLFTTALSAPWVTLVFFNIFRSIPTNIDDAAIVDGGSYWRILLTLIIPQTKKTIFAIFITVLVTSFNFQALVSTWHLIKYDTSPILFILPLETSNIIEDLPISELALLSLFGILLIAYFYRHILFVAQLLIGNPNLIKYSK